MSFMHWLVSAALLFASSAAAQAQKPLVEVWRSPSCGCCEQWVKHLQKNGFPTKVHSVDDTAPMRRALGISEQQGSCHTAKVAGYAIEGHVPAGDIEKLLASKPKARGLTAPGMPAGSPGMDVPGSPPYDVLLVKQDGTTELYATHPGTKK
jgi:hypothetical protein